MRFGFSRLLRPLAFAAALALGAVGFAGLAGADPPIWRIHGPKGEVVLFGSVHLLTPGLDWRSKAMEAALAGATDIWFEIPIDGSTQDATSTAVEQLAHLPPGGSLAKLMSPKGRTRLARVAAVYGVSPAALDGDAPWFVEVTLTLLDLRKSGASQSDGVEQALSQEAPPAATRHAFETPAQQIGFLAGAPISEQVASLEETLRELEEEPDDFAKLQKAWTDGDAAWIEREAVEPLRKAAPGIYDRLVTQRNRRWADEIEGLLKTPDRAFIVVGIGHLVGPDSVPALLRRRGLKVEGP